jgi:uncharacterized OB-fold protein
MLLPELDASNSAFWTGGRDGVLLIHRCTVCGTWVHPPVAYCAACGGRDVAPTPTSGRGHVYCYTVNHMSWMSDGDRWQRVVAIVELEEQPDLRLVTNIVGCESAEVHTGLPVEVTFRSVEDVFLPLFRPRGA